MIRLRTVVGIWVLFIILLNGCQNEAPTPTLAPTALVPPIAAVATTPAFNTPLPPPLPTAVPPTPTPTEPIVAQINETPIFLSTYEEELARYEQAQAGLGIEGEQEMYRQTVLDALIEKTLILQAAKMTGIIIPPEQVTSQLDELRQTAGDNGNYEAWLAANQWTEAEFEAAVAEELTIQAVVDQVTADVPFAVEQVRARYIQLDDLEVANTLLTQLRNGDDFALRAEQYSLDQVTAQTGGDLGYFARGWLLVPEVETAAFALQIGGVSDIISVTNESGETTYYIVQLVERDPQRPLPAAVRNTLLDQTFRAWLNQQRAQATIEEFLDRIVIEEPS